MPLSAEATRLIEAMGFTAADTVCASPNKYAYEAVPTSALAQPEIMLAPNPGTKGVAVKLDPADLLLLSINPIQGPRGDLGVYRYQSFLVEMDDRALVAQRKYIADKGMPFTACVFSGNKSLHHVISLDRPMPDESSWRVVAKWILNAMEAADQQTGNPSRMVRIPGAMRPGGKAQRLVELRGPVSRDDLFAWLSKFPDRRPVAPPPPRIPLKEPSFAGLAPWVRQELTNGIDESRGRNARWFAIGYEMALAGYSSDDALDILGQYLEESHDFRRKEWEAAIRSAYNQVNRRSHGP